LNSHPQVRSSQHGTFLRFHGASRLTHAGMSMSQVTLVDSAITVSCTSCHLPGRSWQSGSDDCVEYWPQVANALTKGPVDEHPDPCLAGCQVLFRYTAHSLT
jgi:hypothetical protein